MGQQNAKVIQNRTVTALPAQESDFGDYRTSDAVIKLQHAIIPIHRAVVCPQSKYINGAFSGASKHDGPTTLDLSKMEHHNHQLAELMLRYLYRGAAALRAHAPPLTAPDLLELWRVAEYFGVPTLTTEAVASFQARMNLLVHATTSSTSTTASPTELPSPSSARPFSFAASAAPGNGGPHACAATEFYDACALVMGRFARTAHRDVLVRALAEPRALRRLLRRPGFRQTLLEQPLLGLELVQVCVGREAAARGDTGEGSPADRGVEKEEEEEEERVKKKKKHGEKPKKEKLTKRSASHDADDEERKRKKMKMKKD